MATRWIDTTSDEDSAFHSIDFWKGLNNNLDAGEFWADRIKRYRGDPAKRLNEAMNNLPLPAAFREAAIATRALITEKRKTGQDYDEELTLLYWLAAIRSFMIEYAPKLKQPGYNVMVSIPAKRIKSLPFSYKSLGYADLELLSKTDCKWIVEKGCGSFRTTHIIVGVFTRRGQEQVWGSSCAPVPGLGEKSSSFQNPHWTAENESLAQLPHFSIASVLRSTPYDL